jgi:hypothetical protein
LRLNSLARTRAKQKDQTQILPTLQAKQIMAQVLSPEICRKHEQYKKTCAYKIAGLVSDLNAEEVLCSAESTTYTDERVN